VSYDLEGWRERFPSLQREVSGRPVAWLDGPGGSQAPEEVADAIADVLRRGVSNLGGAFAASDEAAVIVADARRAVADLIGAAEPDSVAFGQSMTSLNLALARAVSADWGPGDEVVVTRLDHDANVSPWLLAAERTGATVRWVDFDPADGCSLDDVSAVLSDRTRLLAVTHASNAVGTIPDVAGAVGAARSVGAFTVVDAVHHVPHLPTDMAAVGCDALLCSAYKFHGPHIGAMALAPEAWGLVAERIRPASAAQPGKWEAGTASFEALAGVTAAVDALASLGSGSDRRARLVSAMGSIHDHTTDLADRFLAGLRRLDGVHLHGIDDGRARTPTFGITVDGWAPRDVARRLGDQGIHVWDGHFYALEVIRRLGLADSGGLVRIGFLSYTSADEVDRVLAALAAL
jgi:cysteine desulfurase family protein (TIGR01976 family)